MQDYEPIQRLQVLADFIFDLKSRELHALRESLERLRQQVSDLNRQPLGPEDEALGARVAFAYETWASAQRIALELEIEQLQVRIRACEDEARRAFGRKDVLGRLRALGSHKGK